jgi:DNA-binding CsgD family transcriptional regulator
MGLMQNASMLVAEDVVAAIDDAGTMPEVQTIFAAEIRRYGFIASACGYFEITRHGAVPVFFFQDWPQAFIDHYQSANFVNQDAVVAEARRRFLPFAWSEAWAPENLTRGEARMQRVVIDIGWKDGLAVPVHGPAGYFGLVTMACAAPLPGPAVISHLHLLALQAHDRCRRIMGAGERPRADSALSTRELECLRWIARGASDVVIAEQLGLSAHTVKDYIDSARVKLGATTRAQAVAMLMASAAL